MSVRGLLAALVAVTVTANGSGAFSASIRAMACCARTHSECAGLRTPDDCCQRMGHGVATSPSTTTGVQTNTPSLALAFMPALAPQPDGRQARFVLDPTFKRPHDPPHLHLAPLLI